MAFSEAMRKSQFKAISNPPVIAWPLTAPITGFLQAANKSGRSFPSPLGSKIFSLPITERSIPEQNDLPLPVMTAALISLFPETSSRPLYKPIRRFLLIEFLLSGRFNVITAMLFSTLNKTSFSMLLPFLNIIYLPIIH